MRQIIGNKSLKVSPKNLIFLILLGAFFVRLGFVLVLNPTGYYFSDTRHYDAAATRLISGDGFGEKYNRSPGYPVFMALVYVIFGHNFTVMRIVEIFVSLLIIVFIYLCARLIFDQRIALVSSALAALHPHFILIVGILYPTNLFTLLLAVLTFAVLLYEKTSQVGFLALGGLIAGLATLTTPAIIFFIPFLFLWIVLKPGRGIVTKLISLVVFTTVLTAVLTPWTLRNYRIYDRLTFVRPVPHTVFPDLDNLENQQNKINDGFSDTTDYLRENPQGSEKDNLDHIIGNYLKHPLSSLKYLFQEMRHFWAPYPDRLDTQSSRYQQGVQQEDQRMMSTGGSLWKLAKIASMSVMIPLFLLAILGVFTSQFWRRGPLLLVCLLVSFSVGYSLIVAEVRYRIPVEPYLLMFVAAGLLFIFDWIRKKDRNQSILHTLRVTL